MPYITREDGEHFVIPSYRDVITAKQKAALKKEILLLSQSYGEYITLQRKGTSQYEVAFSPDPGYLLGESIWHFFKRPLDLIYCEAIPNTTEAILVIVKAGSVYLDGSFPLDSISEELIIFLTQQNNFEIYLYGDVPISQTPEEGKFSFEAASVRSFTVLDKPVFPTLPLVKAYQLQLVEQVLKSHGIGVFPTKQLVSGLVILGLLWMIYSYYSTKKPVVQPVAVKANPYQGYLTALESPAPDQEISTFIETLKLFATLPGWIPKQMNYANNSLTVSVISSGSKIENLYGWAKQNNAKIILRPEGIYINMMFSVPKRPIPTKIYGATDVVAAITDHLMNIYPGNHIKLDDFASKGVYTQIPLTITVTDVTPMIVDMIGKQLKDLPVVLQSINLTYDGGKLNGTILLETLGS